MSDFAPFIGFAHHSAHKHAFFAPQNSFRLASRAAFLGEEGEIVPSLCAYCQSDFSKTTLSAS